MILYIDTTEFGKVSFALEDSKKKISKTFKVLPQESDRILSFLEKFLHNHKYQPLPVPPQWISQKSQGDFRGTPAHILGREIKKIVIYKGQGSFTGLRVGAAIAQALSMAWGVPIKIASKKK